MENIGEEIDTIKQQIMDNRQETVETARAAHEMGKRMLELVTNEKIQEVEKTVDDLRRSITSLNTQITELVGDTTNTEQPQTGETETNI